MVSHLRVPALDAELPASLSPAAIALLREQVGWRGAVATDDLAMRAITDTYSQPEAAERALAAGQDLLLTSDATAATAIVDRLADAVASGRVPQTRLHDALRRTLPLRGLADADVTCLLGLPPAAQAAAVTGDDGVVYAVEDGQRQRSPMPRRSPTSTSNPAATPRARWTPCRSVSRSRPPVASRSRPWPALRTTPPTIALARTGFLPDASAARVVVATAAGHADALAGAPLLTPGTPLLLARPDLADRLAAEVDRVLAPGGTVYLLGGEAALGPAHLGAVADRPDLTRLAGADRYATAAAIAEVVGSAPVCRTAPTITGARWHEGTSGSTPSRSRRSLRRGGGRCC